MGLFRGLGSASIQGMDLPSFDQGADQSIGCHFHLPINPIQHAPLVLQANEFLQEPVCVSPRPLIGPIVVFARKAFFHLFMKWYLRPMVMQLNNFNSSAGALIRDLVEANRGLIEENRRLSRRLEALEEAVHGREQ